MTIRNHAITLLRRNLGNGAKPNAARLLSRKHHALISEAPCSYPGSTVLLLPSRHAVFKTTALRGLM